LATIASRDSGRFLFATFRAATPDLPCVRDLHFAQKYAENVLFLQDVQVMASTKIR